MPKTPKVELVQPRLYYEGQEWDPIRNSHVYVDLPNDTEGFLHCRTDANGSLCRVADARARAHGPLLVDPTAPLKVFHDDGALSAEEVGALGGSDKVRTVQLAKRKTRRAGQEVEEDVARLPRLPFEITIDVLEVVFTADQGPGYDDLGRLTSAPGGAAVKVEPLPERPGFLSIKGRPAYAQDLPKVEVKEVRFIGWTLREEYEIDAAALGAGPPDFARRLFARACIDEVRRSAIGSLDAQAHSFIRRRYDKIQVAIGEVQLRQARLLRDHPLAPPVAHWDGYIRSPVPVFDDWQEDVFGLFMETGYLYAYEAPYDPAYPVNQTPMDSVLRNGKARANRGLATIIPHNARVKRLHELFMLTADQVGGCACYAILKRNQDTVLLGDLPKLYRSAHGIIRRTVRLQLLARQVWPDVLLPWPLEPRAANRMQAFDAFHQSPSLRVTIADAEVDRIVGDHRDSTIAEDRLLSEGRRTWYALRALARRFERAGDRLAERWAAIDPPDAGKPIPPAMVVAIQDGAAAIANLRVALGRMMTFCLDRQLLGIDELIVAYEDLAQATSLAKRYERDDLKDELVEGTRWIKDRAKALADVVEKARAAWQAASDHASATWLDSEALRRSAEGLRGKTPSADEHRRLAAAIDAVAAKAKALGDLVEAASIVECDGAFPGQEEAPFASTYYLLLEDRAFVLRELKRLSHHAV